MTIRDNTTSSRMELEEKIEKVLFNESKKEEQIMKSKKKKNKKKEQGLFS